MEAVNLRSFKQKVRYHKKSLRSFQQGYKDPRGLGKLVTPGAGM
jgi:hypothetical protein